MSCEFQSLYYGREGYVVRCRQCGHYQLAFLSTMLTLEAQAFEDFCRQVSCKTGYFQSNPQQQSKIIMVAAPSPGVHLVLTPRELQSLAAMLEAADTEAKAQALIRLFRVS